MKLLIIQNALENTSSGISEKLLEIGSALNLSASATKIIGGLLLLFVGFLIAKLAARLFKKILTKSGIDAKSRGSFSIAKFLGKVLYYFIMIFVLMIVLSLVGVSHQVLEPINNMINKFFNAIPNIIVAFIIGYAGYLLAKIVSELVEASGDKILSWIPDSVGIPNNVNIVKVLKTVVFIVIFFPILVIGIEKLQVNAITKPATALIDTAFAVIPNIIYATVILIVSVLGGKFISNILKKLLNGLNFNKIADDLNLSQFLGEANLVSILKNLVYAFIVYLGTIEALKQLNLLSVVSILEEILVIVGNIFFGLIILSLGNVIANFAVKLVNTSQFFKSIIKGAIIVIFLTMGLHAMGIANNIVELAFGLGMGAVAVAFALAFGLGGREAAGQELKSFFERFKKK